MVVWFFFLFFIFLFTITKSWQLSMHPIIILIFMLPPPPPPPAPPRPPHYARKSNSKAPVILFSYIFNHYWRLYLLMLLTWQLSMHTIFISLLLIQPKLTTLPLILSSYYSSPSNVMHNCHHMTDGTVLDCLCSVYSMQWSVTWLHWVICFAAFILTLTA